MIAIIGIFPDERALTEAMDALQALGVDDAAMTVLGGPGQEDTPLPGPGPAILPGTAPDSRGTGVAVRTDRAPGPARAAVVEQLGDLTDNQRQLAYYAGVLAHDGRLLAVRVPESSAGAVVAALEASGANQVDRVGT